MIGRGDECGKPCSQKVTGNKIFYLSLWNPDQDHGPEPQTRTTDQNHRPGPQTKVLTVNMDLVEHSWSCVLYLHNTIGGTT